MSNPLNSSIDIYRFDSVGFGVKKSSTAIEPKTEIFEILKPKPNQNQGKLTKTRNFSPFRSVHLVF